MVSYICFEDFYFQANSMVGKCFVCLLHLQKSNRRMLINERNNHNPHYYRHKRKSRKCVRIGGYCPIGSFNLICAKCDHMLGVVRNSQGVFGTITDVRQ